MLNMLSIWRWGDSYRAIKSIWPDSHVGSAIPMSPGDPATQSEEDRSAARRYDAWANLWFLEPAMSGRYPEAFVGPAPLEEMGFKPGDEQRMKAPLDWIGINYYNRTIVAAKPVTQSAPASARLGFTTSRGMQGPITDKGWEVWPEGLYDVVTATSKRYNIPIQKTAAPTTTAPMPKAAYLIRNASSTIVNICNSSRALSPTGRRFAAIMHGACWTISSGPTDTRSVSASSTWTSGTSVAS